MKIQNYGFHLLVVLLLLLSGCKKAENGEWIDATVLDFGSPAVDGCGFLLQVEDNLYYPENLQEKDQVDKKRVKVRFSLLDEMKPCGFPYSPIKHQKVNIRDIKSK